MVLRRRKKNKGVEIMQTIQKEDLVLEIKEAIRDVFVAKVEMAQETVLLTFLNGQRFQIEIKEIL